MFGEGGLGTTTSGASDSSGMSGNPRFISWDVSVAHFPNRAQISSTSIPPSSSGNTNGGNPGGGGISDSGEHVCKPSPSDAGASSSVTSTTGLVSGGLICDNTGESSTVHSVMASSANDTRRGGGWAGDTIKACLEKQRKTIIQKWKHTTFEHG